MATQQNKQPSDLSQALDVAFARLKAGEIPADDVHAFAREVFDMLPKRKQEPGPPRRIRALRLHQDYDDNLPGTLESLNGFPNDAVDHLVYKIKGSVNVLTMVLSEDMDDCIPKDSIAASLWGIETQLELLEAVLRKSWSVGLIDVPTTHTKPLEAVS